MDFHTIQVSELVTRLESILQSTIDSDWQIWRMSIGVINSIHPVVYQEKIRDFSLVLVVCEGYTETVHEIESQFFPESFENIVNYCYTNQTPYLYSLFADEPTNYPDRLNDMNRGLWSRELNEEEQSETFSDIKGTVISIVNKIKSEREAAITSYLL